MAVDVDVGVADCVVVAVTETDGSVVGLGVLVGLAVLVEVGLPSWV